MLNLLKTPYASGRPLRLIAGCLAGSAAIVLCSCSGLNYCAKAGDVEGMKAALAAGASVDQRDDRGDTALIAAAYSGKALAVEFLCERGADVNAQNPYGATALIYAAYYGHFESAKVLLEHNADRSLRDKYGNTALDYAEYYKFTALISLLQGAESGMIALPWPADAPYAPTDKEADAALITAAAYGDIGTVVVLCRHGVNVNAANDRGATALISAVFYNHPDVAKVLLEHKADQSIKDRYGKTALDYAVDYQYAEIVGLLQSYSGTP